MGMVFSLIKTAPDVIERLRDKPRAVSEFIFQDPEFYEEPKPGLLGRLFHAKASEPVSVPPRRDGDELDLDKSWHIVHYLLTGETENADSPLGLIFDNHDSWAAVDTGFGRPVVILPARVAAFADAARSISDDDFLRRFIPAAMPTDDLYLGEVIARGDHDEMKEYALENFHALRDFAAAAARDGDAIVTYYS